MSNLQMIARRIALALTLTVGLSVAAACTGEMVPLGNGGPASSDDDGDDTTQPPPTSTPDAGTPAADPQTTFNTNVKPLLLGCFGCHQGTSAPLGFLGTQDTMYETIKASGVISTANPAQSTLLTHHHSGAGIELDDAGKATITAWITAEAGQ